jgi:acyl dehydratase
MTNSDVAQRPETRVPALEKGLDLRERLSAHNVDPTQADIAGHVGQTGDPFPHHLDSEGCRTQVFGKRVARGATVLVCDHPYLASQHGDG